MLFRSLLSEMSLLLTQSQERATRSHVDLESYWALVHGKSGNVCGTAMSIGALLGGASPEETEILYQIGKKMGEVGQISNDLRGAFDEQVNPDWGMPGCSLPILLARTTEHPDLEELKMLLAKGLHPGEDLKRAQEILIQSGAVRSCCDEIARRLDAMYQGLCACSLPGKAVLWQKIGEDIRHAIDWVNALEIEQSDETKRIFDGLSKGLSSG